MKYYSTRNKDIKVSFKEALIKGLAADGGLFVPEEIVRLPDSFLENLESMSPIDMATEIMLPYVEEDIPKEDLKQILTKVLSFDFPLVKVDDNKYALELFHGPTLAFKDVGAGFLARCLGYFSKVGENVNVLVATSGDTGSAVANGFFNVEGTEVTILYPSGKVSPSQEKQLTTYGNNINALEVDGTFDDCQKIVKEAFQDEELNEKMKLSSANSINVARFLPQSLYYFIALAKYQNSDKEVIVSVPSGNFGNILAAIYAKNMGLKIDKFVVSNNANNPVVEYLNGDGFRIRPSIQTISNAMDIGNPSNFERLIHLYPELEQLKELAEGYYFDDKSTLEAIEHIFKKYNYIADPHGAVAYLGLSKAMKDKKNVIGVFVETAHPAKFIETFTEEQKKAIHIPDRLLKFMDKEKKSIKISSSYKELKRYLLNA